MAEQIAQKIVYAEVDSFMAKYYGRRIEVTCKDGTILAAKLDWFAEMDEEEEGDVLGIMLDDVVKADGEEIPGIVLPFSYIDTFIPLEGENSDEEIKRLWPG